MTRLRLLQRGFSLLEVVLVLFLTGVVLFCVSRLTSQSLETMKFLREKSQTLESATLGCERLSSELSEAVEVTPGSNVVSFRKVRPSAPEAIGNLLEDSSGNIIPASTWVRTYPAANRVVITYEVNSSDQLRRSVLGETNLVATDVNAFSVTPMVGAGSYLIRLGIREKRRVVAFEAVVTCPALQAGFGP